MSFESSNSTRSTQGSMFDHFDGLDEKTRQMLLDNKYGTFRMEVYPYIDVESYKVL